MSRDTLFVRVVYVLVGLIIAYGIGVTMVLLIVHPEDSTVIRFINSFGTIFAGLLGLCGGYLMGKRDNGA